MSKIAKIIGWLTAQVGNIYVWGAQGETATEDFIRKMETSETNAKRALTLYNKRKAEGKNPIKAYDCSGLIVCYLLENKLISGDSTAAGLYGKCAKITRDKLKAGDFVFRHNGARIHHIGVYVGGDMVIHSKGRDVGVVSEHIDANGDNYWNRYGRYEKLQEREVTQMATELKITNPLMKGDAICELQEALNRLGYDCGEPDGVCGKNTMKAVQQFADKHTTKKLPNSLSVSVQIGNKVYKGDVK